MARLLRGKADRILELNRQGVQMVELYAAIFRAQDLHDDDPGFVDLTSPAGIGIGALVYNYDGKVYASDEGRMLAEMDDDLPPRQRPRDDYADIMLSDSLLDPLTQSFAASAPMCATCALEPYCGADPVYHHATAADFLGHKAFSGFCERNTGVFTAILRRARDDSFARHLFYRWANQ